MTFEIIDGAQSDLNWTSADISHRTAEYIDVRFNATEGEMHWVIYHDLAGAYQYFVNRALPVLGEFRTLWRLDNATFPNARTNEKDGPLPDLALYANATKVQDETWQLSSGEYLTKYDWTTFLRAVDYYGVYGDSFGSWYINPGKDYFNGDHLKQELIVSVCRACCLKRSYTDMQRSTASPRPATPSSSTCYTGRTSKPRPPMPSRTASSGAHGSGTS